MTHSIIYSELGEKTNADLQFTCAHNGKLYVRTHMKLSGRGIKLGSDGSNASDGRKSYFVTEKAFEQLQTKYSSCFLANL